MRPEASADDSRAADSVLPLEIDGADALLPFRPVVDGEWDRAAAAHLARRTGIGSPPGEVERILALGPVAAVESLTAPVEDAAATLELLETARSVNGIDQAQAWWIHEMLHGASPFREKLALFWHGHFATSDEKVNNPRLMLDQIMLFRRGGHGPFGELVEAVARDPAMLIWLDGNLNRAGAPNENFAREVMELFTLGIGNYTEADIKEAARAFTGWHVRGISFWFNRRAHDAGPKRVLGHDGVESGEEVVGICVRHRASSRFVAGKLFAYFVHPRPGKELVERLADLWEACERRAGRFLGRLLASRLFFDPRVRRTIVASPVDYAIGTLRTLGARAAPGQVARRLREMGQDLLRPPNVKGWDGGRAWISSTTILARLKFALDLVEEKPLGVRVDWEAVAGADPIAGVVERCFPGGIDAGLRERLAAAAGSSDPRRVLAAAMQLPEYQMV